MAAPVASSAVCGIVAVVHRPSDAEAPSPAAIVALLGRAEQALAQVTDVITDEARLAEASEALGRCDRALRGPAGVRRLLGDPDLVATIDRVTGALGGRLGALDDDLDGRGRGLPTEARERLTAALDAVKDPVWALGRDRLGTARGVAALAPGPARSAIGAYWAVQVALAAIDRLEVRGRDSAGLHVMVHDHGLDLDDLETARALRSRRGGLRFGHRAAEAAGPALSFVYKAAAEIGELGDNTRTIRSALVDDDLFRRAVSGPDARVTVLAHTRWASVGLISEANAHPLNQIEEGGHVRPYVVGALNGDVDNHADLKAANRLAIPAEVTTDAKVIPSLVARRLDDGAEATEAVRATVAGFEGSVAVAVDVAGAADQLHLALRGSGQGLYVGLATDTFVVASEPYGVVEIADRYLRMDGESSHDPGDPGARGQMVVLERSGAGDISGLSRLAYDGTPLPVGDAELVTPEITTRDIDRGDAPHFLLKELREAPGSLRATLRGRITSDHGAPRVVLDDGVVPPDVRARLADGRIRRIRVIGQGTAAVAGRSLVRMLDVCAPGIALDARAMPATELSGFELSADMSDTLVVAISQSGTTTDTNRTVDLARGRGAAVIAVVNRRGSDLVDRADGVLYTSDGRDIEMSVASTKAFYAQVAAGTLLALALAEAAGADAAGHGELLRALGELPEAMTEVLARREVVRVAAVRHAPSRRHWALVGNGANRIAADEVRIKLSELCYRAIPSDATEDKKHIDLSSEPLILVCAAGLYGSNADDVAKEVAIFRAHQAVPIVVATEGEDRFASATELIEVPTVHSELDFVLAAMVGHLFGYEAARAIDASARPMRELRSAIDDALAGGLAGEELTSALGPAIARHATAVGDLIRSHDYDGTLDASVAVRLVSVLRYATGTAPLDSYEIELGRLGTPDAIIEDLSAALSVAIDQLTRPIDAIKHQAKTVTVGISRSDDDLLRSPLVAAVLDAGAPRDRLSYQTLRTLVGLSPAVADVRGWTRYRVEGDPRSDAALVGVIDRGGLAREIPSRTAGDPTLRGTKRRAAEERTIWTAVGRSDGRTVIHVPEVKGAQTTGLTLLHVSYHEHLPAAEARRVLEAFKDRYGALRDIVTETEPTFRDDVLARVPIVDLLTLPVAELAAHWTTAARRG